MTRYSPIFMEHFNNPRNTGELDSPSAVGKADVSGRAPYFTIYIEIYDDIVKRATFKTFGCGAAIAAGSAITELLRGLSRNDCEAISQRDIIEYLGGVPDNKAFCVDLALRSLHDALKQLHI